MKIAGVDEVGRGPLAGPVVAAAVILKPNHTIVGLTDSKKLSAKKREQLSQQIKEQSEAWCIESVEVDDIDRINILQASLLAMKKAVEGLSIAPDLIKVDGIHLPDLNYSMEAVIKGDLTEKSISAASIIAKVSRDNTMKAMDLLYPEYGFAKHKGYPTKQHRDALLRYGVTPIHRVSYAPVKAILQQQGEVN